VTAELTPVRRAAAKAVEWTETRNAAIREARAGGASLRSIAEAAGLSHTAVAKIVGR
jgi:hypothetical protein